MFKQRVDELKSQRENRGTIYRMSTSTLVILLLATPGVAIAQSQGYIYSQDYYRDYPGRNYDSPSLRAGSQIPLRAKEGEKILVTKTEVLDITLRVAQEIRNEQGLVVIPFGAEVVGQIQPAGTGAQFVAQSLILPNGRRVALQGNSRIVTRTENISRGTNPRTILQGAVVGAAAATVLAAVTGDKAIATEEVLSGVGFGALGGWLFGGNRSQELISIDPNRDLDLILTSDLFL